MLRDFPQPKNQVSQKNTYNHHTAQWVDFLKNATKNGESGKAIIWAGQTARTRIYQVPKYM
jgi:hypothetical protein